MWSTQEANTRPVTPSTKLEGPNPGSMWAAQEQQTQPVTPSPAYPGPRPH
jgi:hypothetical protein